MSQVRWIMMSQVRGFRDSCPKCLTYNNVKNKDWIQAEKIIKPCGVFSSLMNYGKYLLLNLQNIIFAYFYPVKYRRLHNFVDLRCKIFFSGFLIVPVLIDIAWLYEVIAYNR